MYFQIVYLLQSISENLHLFSDETKSLTWNVPLVCPWGCSYKFF